MSFVPRAVPKGIAATIMSRQPELETHPGNMSILCNHTTPGVWGLGPYSAKLAKDVIVHAVPRALYDRKILYNYR